MNQESFVVAARNSEEEKGEQKGRRRLLRLRDSADLGKVAFGSATQDFWQRDRKVRSHAVGVNRCRSPGRRTVGKVRREGR